MRIIRRKYYIQTILPSNLRPTTREFVHLVTRGHFRSRDTDCGYIIRFTIVENPMLNANLMAFIEPEFWAIELLHCVIRDFLKPFLLLWPWPWVDDLYIQTWPVFPGDTLDMQNMNFVSRLWKVIVWQTERHTRQKLYTIIPLHWWPINENKQCDGQRVERDMYITVTADKTVQKQKDVLNYELSNSLFTKVKRRHSINNNLASIMIEQYRCSFCPSIIEAGKDAYNFCGIAW